MKYAIASLVSFFGLMIPWHLFKVRQAPKPQVPIEGKVIYLEGVLEGFWPEVLSPFTGKPVLSCQLGPRIDKHAHMELAASLGDEVHVRCDDGALVKMRFPHGVVCAPAEVRWRAIGKSPDRSKIVASRSNRGWTVAELPGGAESSVRGGDWRQYNYREVTVGERVYFRVLLSRPTSSLQDPMRREGSEPADEDVWLATDPEHNGLMGSDLPAGGVVISCLSHSSWRVGGKEWRYLTLLVMAIGLFMGPSALLLLIGIFDPEEFVRVSDFLNGR